MAKKFSELRAKMSRESRERAEARSQQLLAEMPLYELRQCLRFTQGQMAELLEMSQGNVSRLEKQTDMFISTLRTYIEAMGGHLEIVAHFPEGDVRINQFEDIEAKSLVQRETEMAH